MDNLDKLFESREVLQDKGKFAINALQYLISEEKLSGEFYPALNTFMIEFIEKFELVEKLSNVDYCNVISFMAEIDKDEDRRIIQRSISNIKNVILKYKDLIERLQYDDCKLNKAFGFLGDEEVEITPEDNNIITKNKQIFKFLTNRKNKHKHISHSSFYKYNEFLTVVISLCNKDDINYLTMLDIKDIIDMSDFNAIAIPLFKLDDQISGLCPQPH